jgi:hypothetical protein
MKSRSFGVLATAKAKACLAEAAKPRKVDRTVILRST